MAEVSYAVILTRGAARAETALRSIAAQGVSHELLLVLNDADEPMRELAHAWVQRGARIVHDGIDLGIALAYDVALAEARAALFCTVHEDSEPDEGCVRRLADTLREHPEAAAVVPRVDVPGTGIAEAPVLWSDAAVSHVPAPCDEPVFAVDFGETSCLMLRRPPVAAIGGLDPAFFPAYYGDVDLGARLWQAGWAVLCDRRARNVHRTGAMVDDARGPRHGARHRQFLLHRSRERFVARHSAWLGERPRRRDPHDARHPEEDEVRDALARIARRWRELPASAVAGPPKLDVPDRLKATVELLRRELADEFLEHVLEENRQLTEENTRLHEAYAALHDKHVTLNAEADRVHAAYAELHTETESLRAGLHEQQG